MASQRAAVGIDLGGTHVQFGVVDAGGAVLARRGAKTGAERGAEAVIADLASGVGAVCEEAGVDPAGLAGVGVGAPGAMDASRETVLAAPNLEWYGVELRRLLSDRLGGLRVEVDNDVNVAVYGEQAFGAAKGEKDVFGVWVGTGVGGGFVLGGRPYRGALGSAGEIGMTVHDPALPEDERRLEHHTSRKYVARLIVEAIEAGGTSALRLDPGGAPPTAGEMARAYNAGDSLVRGVVDRSAGLLGVAIANTLTVTAVPVVVMGGGLTEALGEHYVQRVARGVRRHFHPASSAESIDVRITALRENAGLLGAAMLALEDPD